MVSAGVVFVDFWGDLRVFWGLNITEGRVLSRKRRGILRIFGLIRVLLWYEYAIIRTDSEL